MNSKTRTREPGKSAKQTTVRLRLFVAGDEPNSEKAKAVLYRLCGKHLKNHFELHIVDVLEDYQAAIDHHVVAVPSLIVEKPSSSLIIVGSLSDEGKVISALGLAEQEERP